MATAVPWDKLGQGMSTGGGTVRSMGPRPAKPPTSGGWPMSPALAMSMSPGQPPSGASPSVNNDMGLPGGGQGGGPVRPTGNPGTPGGGIPGTQVAQTPQAAIGLGNLGAVLERRLANPTAFNGDVMNANRGAFRAAQDLDLQEGFQNLDADAASRGVFFSTIPTAGRGELLGRSNAASKMFDAQLLTEGARAHDAGLQGAIGDAMGFLDRANQDDERRRAGIANLGQTVLAGGQLGMPDLTSLTNSFSMFQPSGGGQSGFGDLGSVLQLFMQGRGA